MKENPQSGLAAEHVLFPVFTPTLISTRVIQDPHLLIELQTQLEYEGKGQYNSCQGDSAEYYC